jgi:integrase
VRVSDRAGAADLRLDRDPVGAVEFRALRAWLTDRQGHPTAPARDLGLVADVLGHADVKTTRRYARSELEERRAALEALDR